MMLWLSLGVLLCASLNSGYVLRRPDTEENRLAEALEVLQEQRERLNEAGIYDDDYWTAPIGGSPYEPLEEVNVPEPADTYGSDDAFLQELFDNIEADPSSTDNADTGAEQPVDEQELEDIFDEATNDMKKQEDDKEEDNQKEESEEKEEEEKRNIPWQLGGPILHQRPDKKAGEKLTEAEVNKILADVEEVEKEKMVENSASSAEAGTVKQGEEHVAERPSEVLVVKQESTVQPVSDKELQNILNGDSQPNTEPSDEDAPDTVSEQVVELEGTPGADEAEETNGGGWGDYPVTEQDDEQLSKEWLWNQYLQDPYSGGVKRKRSQDFGPDENFLEDEEADEEIVETMEECLQRLIALEDEENTQLAQALNLATLGQVERTDRYIPDEVRFLKSAVDNEQRLKQLRRCLRLGAGAGGAESPEVIKRSRGNSVLSQEMMEEIPEQTQEADVNDMLTEKLKQYMRETQQQNTQQDDDNEYILNPLYRELYEKYSSQPSYRKRQYMDYDDTLARLEQEELEAEEEEAEEEAIIKEEALQEQLEREEALEEEELAEEREEAVEAALEQEALESAYEREQAVEAALENYIEQLSPAEQEELQEEVEEALGAIPLTEVNSDLLVDRCPAVELYTDGCAYAVSMGLELDAEATQLCNRHQLCYTCGSEFGLTYKDCDKGYLEEADLLCEAEAVSSVAECQDEAAGLYVVMARGHRFVPPGDADSMCQSSCVLDYIVGPEGV